MDQVKPGYQVLILWQSAVAAETLSNTVHQLQEVVGSTGKVQLENVERLTMAAYGNSTFDVVLSGTFFPHTIVHNVELIGDILKILKPNGKLVLQQAVVTSSGSSGKTESKLVSTVKLSGMVNVSVPEKVSLSDDELLELKGLLRVNESVQVVRIECHKPNFEVGSSSLLSFAKSPAKPSSDVAAVWKIDDTVDDEIIDSDQLLDEDDLKKPDPSTLKVCGTTGKRKACKNCSCGLAEELATEGIKTEIEKPKTSACGNCYLGDAFRCASCPYLGMPAFKPGEKIELSDQQLKADV